MAKPRKATALFEVYGRMRSDAQSDKPSFQLGMPGWLRRDKTETDSAPPADPPISISDHEPSAPSHPGLRVSVDSVHQTINVMLSFGGAAVAGSVLVVMIGLAYIVGRHSSRSPIPLLADRTTEELRRDQPRADVLELHPESANPAIARSLTPTQAAKPSPKPQAWNDPRPPSTLVVDDMKRTVGLNYVIIQSYPDEKEAQNARDLLLQRGILCTVEPAPANWSHSSWKMYSVIGIKGFDKIRNSEEFDAYIRSIMEVSKEFAGRVKFKQFEPAAYKWRETK